MSANLSTSQLNQISGAMVDSAMRVHSALGPGLRESAYEAAVSAELTTRGLRVRGQLGFPIAYEGVPLGEGYRCDVLVNECVIIEIKSVDCIAPVHVKQVLTYLRLADIRLGLIINFNVAHLKDGIKRVVNRLEE